MFGSLSIGGAALGLGLAGTLAPVWVAIAVAAAITTGGLVVANKIASNEIKHHTGNNGMDILSNLRQFISKHLGKTDKQLASNHITMEQAQEEKPRITKPLTQEQLSFGDERQQTELGKRTQERMQSEQQQEKQPRQFNGLSHKSNSPQEGKDGGFNHPQR